MELWLLRHAKAEDFSTSGRDQDRALTEQGQRTCHELNAWLSDHIKTHPAPQTIRTSPALRTSQTIHSVVGELPLPEPQSLDALWAATTGDLVAIIESLATAPAPIWLVGHNPGLSDLVAWLAGPLPMLGMKPGTLVRLSVEMPLNPGAGKIIEVVQMTDRL